jgi:hypothetical protein
MNWHKNEKVDDAYIHHLGRGTTYNHILALRQYPWSSKKGEKRIAYGIEN